MSTHNLTRRQALGAAGAIVAGSVAGSTLAQGQTPPASGVRPTEPGPVRLAPRAELVNSLEYEEQARLKLAPAVYSLVSGGDRAAFDRITLRPRLLVPTLDMDLSVTLFGDTLFAPIVVGPIGNQRRFHADGELATVKGASAARAVTVVSSHSSIPLAGDRGPRRDAALVSGVRERRGGQDADPGCGEGGLQGDLHHGGCGAGAKRWPERRRPPPRRQTGRPSMRSSAE